MSNPIVIDISHWQNTPDFKKVKAGGTVGVILKATEGTGYVDPTYKARAADAKAAGLCVSTYHFLKKGSIAQQMQFYVKTVNPKVGERLVIDYEDSALVISDLELAISSLKAYAPGCEITVYGANGFLGAQLAGKKNTTLAACSLWVASYTSKPDPTMTDLKGTWPYWSLWQYTDKATVSGVSGGVDGNRWNGDAAYLPGWFYADHKIPTPEPEPTPEPIPSPDVIVKVDIVSPVGVTMEVTVNGKKIAT